MNPPFTNQTKTILEPSPTHICDDDLTKKNVLIVNVNVNVNVRGWVEGSLWQREAKTISRRSRLCLFGAFAHMRRLLGGTIPVA